ncbi:MAG TPA: 4Fe-4S dicluster domain-containing protein [Acidobacteriota bacterium]|nr:4Fe-4S dicluster domain-containing protein [Acidobacteriota bacterium]
MAESKKAGERKKTFLRRDFLAGSGVAIAAGALSICAPESAAALAQETTPAAKPSYAPSTGYIVYDSRLCWGCQSCMFACSSSHQGEANPALSRIQIIRDAPSFTKYPLDVVMAPCRQCVTPLCVQNCPTGAAHVDAEHGNVRVIDQAKCIGCKKCIQMCPQRPHRTVWNPYKKKSSKCDLCIDAPFWSKKGGPGGEPACVAGCPAHALKLVAEPPPQEDVAGYDVNLDQPRPKMPPRVPGTPMGKQPASKS